MPALDKEHASGMDIIPNGPDLRSGRANVQRVNKQLAVMNFGLDNPQPHNHLCSSEDSFFQRFVAHLGTTSAVGGRNYRI